MEFLGRIYLQPLSIIRIWIMLLLIIWTVGRYYLGERRWWRLANGVVLGIAVLGILFFTVLHRSTVNQEAVMLIPFHSFIEARAQPEKYREMLMNEFLFVPFGLTAPNVLSRLKQFWPVVITVVSAMMFSTVIELTQYYFRLGRCEVDDVIMNTIGAGIGANSYVIASQLQRILSKKNS